MKGSLHYYGIDIKEFKSLPHEEVLYIKIIASKKLLKKLVIDEDMEDYYRINDVQKAIKLNGELLLELGLNMFDISKKINELVKKGN